MAYSFQTYTVGQVLTAASMNQEEVNIRDHEHGIAGVADPKTLKPQLDNTYDLGTSTLRWSSGYINQLLGRSRTSFDDFILGGGAAPPYFTFVTGGTPTVTFTSSNAGRAILDLNSVNDTLTLISVRQPMLPDWTLAVAEMRATITTMTNQASVYIGFVGSGTTPNINFSAFVLINSGFLRPRNNKAGTNTDGTDIATAINTLHIFRVEARTNTVAYYFNGTLKDSLTTNIPITAVGAGIHINNQVGANRQFQVDWMALDVSS